MERKVEDRGRARGPQCAETSGRACGRRARWVGGVPRRACRRQGDGDLMGTGGAGWIDEKGGPHDGPGVRD
jgi:hypothetical protein